MGDFTGIRGIPNQDIAMWETMGPIAERTKEKLGASDLAVVELPHHGSGPRAMGDSSIVIGRTTPHIPHANISSSEGMLPKNANWRTADINEWGRSSVSGQARVA